MFTLSVTSALSRAITRGLTGLSRTLSIPFTMGALFANGEVGGFYKASDLASQRQYSDGTRPVSEQGQSVGLWLDQSRASLVSANMVTANATGAFGNNYDRAELNAAPGWVANQWYRMEGFYDGTQDTEPAIRIGDTEIIRPPRGFTGPVYFRAPANVQPNAPLYIAGANNGQGGISWANLTCVAVYGNHAYQTSNGQRPLARGNYLYMLEGSSLLADFPQALGTNATVVRAVPGVGAQILTGQAIGKTYSITGNTSAILIINRALTISELAGVTAWANEQAGVQAADRIMAVTPWNGINHSTFPVGAGKQIATDFSAPIAGGPNVTELDLFAMWFLVTADSTGLGTNVTNDGNILEISAECDGVTVPAYFTASGTRDFVIPDGSGGVPLNSLPAAAFNKAFWSPDDTVHIKTKMAFPQGGLCPFSSRTTELYERDRVLVYDPLVTTVSSVDTPGPFTWTGPAPDSISIGYTPWVLGKFATGGAHVGLNRSDSIGAGVGDDGVGTLFGKGMFQRKLGLMPIKASGINLGVPGGKAWAGLHDARVQALARFCTFAELGLGTNDLGRSDANHTTAQSVVDTLLIMAADLRAAGIKTVGVRKLLCCTNDDTGQYITEADQRVVAGWGPSEVVDEFAALILVNPGFDYVLNGDAIRGVNRYKFAVDGITPIWNTNDGLHPQRHGHMVLAAEDARVTWAAIKAANDPDFGDDQRLAA